MAALSLIPGPLLTLPDPVKPRRLVRLPTGKYRTSDEAYRVNPCRVGSKLTMWQVLTGGRDGGPWELKDEVPSLREVRRKYCAPGGVVPWIVAADAKEGVLRVARTRAAAVAWAEAHTESAAQGCYHQPGSTWYSYVFSDPDLGGPEAEDVLWFMRADSAWRHGYDSEQQPLYPYPSHPHEPGPRAPAAAPAAH